MGGVISESSSSFIKLPSENGGYFLNKLRKEFKEPMEVGTFKNKLKQVLLDKMFCTTQESRIIIIFLRLHFNNYCYK